MKLISVPGSALVFRQKVRKSSSKPPLKLKMAHLHPSFLKGDIGGLSDSGFLVATPSIPLLKKEEVIKHTNTRILSWLIPD